LSGASPVSDLPHEFDPGRGKVQIVGLVHPIAFQAGPFTVTWYGIMVALAFLAGLWTASRRGLRDGFAAETILDLGPWLIVGAILGARTLYVISYWNEQFAGEPILEIFKVWRGGLVYYGGLIGASLACILYARVKKLPLWKLADVVAPSIALGYVFGRLGCLMNGCCYGRECHLPWAITFPPGSHLAPAGIPLHPTQIYDSLLNLGFYAFLAWLYRRKKFDGQVFAAYLIGYALLRSLVEFFRGDYPVHYLGGWATPAQVVSIVILAAGLILLGVLPRMTHRYPDTTQKPSHQPR
jgi:phosphatidylglycerol:prolipoprotein diacylglycerol transferase